MQTTKQFNRSALKKNAIQSSSPQFTSQDLSLIVKKIKDLEKNLRDVIAERAYKTIVETKYVEKEKEKEYSFIKEPIPWALVKFGIKKPEKIQYYETNEVEKRVKKNADEVDLEEFRKIIHEYIDELENLNVSLSQKIEDVNGTVDAITETIINFEVEVHEDLVSFEKAQETSVKLRQTVDKFNEKIKEYKRTDSKYVEIATTLERLLIELERSLAEESRKAKIQRVKTSYQNALRQYQKIVLEFARRGEEHCELVKTFSNGTRHMADAVSDVAQICEGVGKATQAMTNIVESVEEGNGVLSEYATLIDNTTYIGSNLDHFEKLKQAKNEYEKREEQRLQDLTKTRNDMAALIHGEPLTPPQNESSKDQETSVDTDEFISSSLKVLED